jgi:hypothetical protein
MTDVNLPRHIIEKFERRWASQRGREPRYGRTDTGAAVTEEAKRVNPSPLRPHRRPGVTSPRLAS